MLKRILILLCLSLSTHFLINGMAEIIEIANDVKRVDQQFFTSYSKFVPELGGILICYKSKTSRNMYKCYYNINGTVREYFGDPNNLKGIYEELENEFNGITPGKSEIAD